LARSRSAPTWTVYRADDGAVDLAVPGRRLLCPDACGVACTVAGATGAPSDVVASDPVVADFAASGPAAPCEFTGVGGETSTSGPPFGRPSAAGGALVTLVVPAGLCGGSCAADPAAPPPAPEAAGETPDVAGDVEEVGAPVAGWEAVEDAGSTGGAAAGGVAGAVPVPDGRGCTMSARPGNNKVRTIHGFDRSDGGGAMAMIPVTTTARATTSATNDRSSTLLTLIGLPAIRGHSR